jgi:hypothetical protein
MSLDPFSAGMTLADTVIKRIWADPSEAEKNKLEALSIAMASELAIHETNKTEAQHPSLFVAGWRPFIGWCGGLGVAYAFIVQPFGSWVAAVLDQPALPVLDTGVLTTVVFTMLGMGGLRTYEKMQGTSRTTWAPVKQIVDKIAG